MPSSLTPLACFSTAQQPHSPSYKAPKLPSTTCGTCRSHPSPCLTTLRLFFSPFRNCLTLDSWPIGTERSVPPPSPPFLMPSHQTLSATSLALLLLWSANRQYPPLSLSTSFGHLDTLRQGIASTRKLPSPSALGLSRRDRIRSLFLDDVDDHDAETEEDPSFTLTIPSPSVRRSSRLAH